MDTESVPAPHPDLAPDGRFATPRTVRWIELILLLAVAFWSSLYHALSIGFGWSSFSAVGSTERWSFSLTHELVALGLCAYLLHKQGRTFRQLGLTARWYDPFYAVGIMLLGLLATLGTGLALYYSGLYTRSDLAAHGALNQTMLGPHIGAVFIVFLIVNAVFEELIVRAYLLTDLRFLTGSTALAVVASAVFQGAYHLYQGWQSAVCVTGGFLVFSLFYVWSRRITPVILAHMFWDLCVTGLYVYWQSHHRHG